MRKEKRKAKNNYCFNCGERYSDASFRRYFDEAFKISVVGLFVSVFVMFIYVSMFLPEVPYYINGFQFFMIDDISNAIGQTDQHGTILIEENMSMGSINLVCRHEMLHQFLDYPENEEHEIIRQIENRVYFPECDELMERIK